MKTSELIGSALDWAVAKCVLGNNFKYTHVSKYSIFYHDPGDNKEYLKYSTNWSQGGPIIEREEIDVYCHESPKSGCGWWVAEITGTKAKAKGNTPLIAAMRCFVASKLGDGVEVPEELK